MKKIIIVLFLIGMAFVPFIETLGGDVSHPQRINFLNSPPTRPILNGPTSGETGTSYTYMATSTDPDGDNIIYCFDWGDGTNIFCTTPLPSGETASVTHTWTTDGDYTITCKASDPTGAESEPVTLRVSMPNDIRNSQGAYTGRLRLYVVEPLSQWSNEGAYDFGFLDFALDDMITIEYQENYENEITWDATQAGWSGVKEDNLMVIAVIFNSEKNQGYSSPPSDNPFDAYYVDAAARAIPGETGMNRLSNGFTHTVFIEEGTATWCGPCRLVKDALHNIYESGDYPFYYAAMVTDKNIVAETRITEDYNLYVFPTIYFDGGRKVVAGASNTIENQFRSLIEECGQDSVHNLNLTVSVKWLSEGSITIGVRVTNLGNSPTRPILNGPTSGETGTSYTYMATSTDPDGDNIIYCFDWGDGTNIFCTTPLPSGETASVTHTWTTDGDYTITCKASDPTGAESEPVTLRVSMPKNKDKHGITILKPKNGLYIHGTKIIPLIGQVVVGDIEIKVRVSDVIEKVEFRLNRGNEMEPIVTHVDTTSPFSWNMNNNNPLHGPLDIRIAQITAVGYDINGENITDKVTILQI